MRHRKQHSKLSMMSAHRKATLLNMVRSLIKHQKIETIHRRAKEVSRLTDRLITISKDNSVLARRKAYSVLCDRDLVAKLFNEIAPLFKNRTGGYTRIIPLGFRRGDGASMAILELTEKTVIHKLPKKAKGKAKAEEPKEAAKKGAAAKGEEQPKKEKAAEEAHAKEEHHKEPKAKTISKGKPSLEEEKRTEKARAEDKKIGDKKKFMSNLRGFFHRKTDM
jgi:large subunit ribosomal protein L17